MDDEKIKYSDIIEPDDSIIKLVGQLEAFNKQFEATLRVIKREATEMKSFLKSTSGATGKGREAIEETTASALKLEKAYRALSAATLALSKQEEWYKTQVVSLNNVSEEQQKYIKQTITSHDRLKVALKQSVAAYKALAKEGQATSDEGQALLTNILNLQKQIQSLTTTLKAQVDAASAVEKAEKRLAYLQSEEGQRLLEIKQRIKEVTAARKEQKTAMDPVAQAQEKLAYAKSTENQQLKLYSTLIREANRVAQLNNQIAMSAEGSYNRLAAQYELNKIKLNAMSAAEREATNSGKMLEAETLSIYLKMQKLQEATGNYRLAVGHYERTWNALGFSIAQVVRELPAAAVSLNTFFLGISNNIPMVVDEINKLRYQNKMLAKEGKPTINITKQIVKALMSWNTWLVIVLSVLSVYGKEITAWVASLFKGKNAVISLSKALQNVNAELEKTNNGYGKSIVTLQLLQSKWADLKTVAEKTKFIEDYESSFRELDVSITSVVDAENLFINNTETFIESLKLRAKASAAQKLAAEEYEKALLAEHKAEIQLQEGPTTGDKVAGYSLALIENLGGSYADFNKTLEDYNKSLIARFKNEQKEATKLGDTYFELYENYLKMADKLWGASNIREYTKTSGRGRRPIDLTNTINRNQITLQRKYEESITKLTNDEFAKRRKAAADYAQDENNKLREMYRKNEVYVANVEGKYRALTEAQKQQIAQQQEWINKTIENNLKVLAITLQKIQKEQQVNSERLRRETINNMSSAPDTSGTVVTTQTGITVDQKGIEQSLVKERKLMEEALDLEYQLVLDTNRKLVEAGDEGARSEEEILTELNKKKVELYAKYDKQILTIRQQNIDDQLELVKKGSREELALLIAKIEVEEQLALAENAAKPAAQQVSTSVIGAKYDKKSKLTQGQFTMESYDQQQALAKAKFDTVKNTERLITTFTLTQERDRWLKQIALAEQGALDWSDAQIEAAKATVIGINREIKELNDPWRIIGQKGVTGSLLDAMGFDDEGISAFYNATNIIIDNIQQIIDAEVELAEKAVEAAEKRVEAAQSVYDAEVEARNNGYANNVASARRELDLEKRKQQQKEMLLAEAQRRQEAINSLVQASSLITASAQLWASFSGVPFVGPALAIAAIAGMWGSFIASKIKAAQVTAVQEYGEGGLEFLEGGSHASGNDIDLGVNNRRKKRMRAEGGEALAVINKRRTRQYRRELPGIIDSLNKGTFEDKYLNAFNTPDNVRLTTTSVNVDLSKLERDVQSIKKQNDSKVYVLPNGTMIVQHKNIKRIIKS